MTGNILQASHKIVILYYVLYRLNHVLVTIFFCFPSLKTQSKFITLLLFSCRSLFLNLWETKACPDKVHQKLYKYHMLKVQSTVKIRRTRVPPECNSARGKVKALFHNNTKYAFHTQSRIKNKFSNHSKFIYT